MSHFEYLDNIPKLSSMLIDTVWHCATHKIDKWPFKETEKGYELYAPNPLLYKFTKQVFGDNYECMVQVIKEGVKIHKDINRRTAYNFIVDCGGEHATTCYYNDQMELIEQIKIQPLRWHKLDVTVFHNVTNLSHNRVAFTVFIPE